VERLHDGLTGPLTLLSAPAGSGKTTLLSEWRARYGTEYPVAWISLDSGDNDPLRFFFYLVAALDRVQPGLLEKSQHLLQGDSPNLEAILTLVSNYFSECARDFMLALDDYHLIDNSIIHTWLTFLLEHLPPCMHLVILTRADPLLPLARLRARNQLAEIRIEHLRFTTDEAAAFLNQVMGLNLSASQVAALEARTEGWIAGLQLAALTMQGHHDIPAFIAAFTGSHHYIVDYLAEEVLSRQPEGVRDFLVKTSVLKRFTAPLCNALLGNADGESILRQLEHQNLFVIPLDAEHRWYRYHYLFADLLRSRLYHSCPELVPGLHAEAAKWFEDHDLVDEALDHALEAKNYEHAARLFCKDQMQIIYTRSLHTLNHWLEAFPDPFIHENPWLCIAKAHVLWAAGQHDRIAPYIVSAEQVLPRWIDSGQFSETDPDYLILRGETLIFQSMHASLREDWPVMLRLAQRAVDIIPKMVRNRAYALGSLYLAHLYLGEIDRGIETCLEAVDVTRKLNYPSMQSTAVFTLAQLFRIKGQLRLAAQVLHEALDYADRQGQAHVFYYGVMHFGLAETLYEWNSLDEMESALNTGLALCWQGGMNILLPFGFMAQVLLKYAQGDLHRALELIDKVERDCVGMDPSIYQDGCKFMRSRIRAELGDYTGLSEWVKRMDLHVESKISPPRFTQLYRAMLALYLLDRTNEALQILKPMETIAREGRYTGWQISIAALQAVIWKKKNDKTQAIQSVGEALALAEPEGYQRVFLNLGEPMRELLHSAQQQGMSPTFASKILAAYTGPHPSSAIPPTSKIPSVLSKREIELLDKIAAGLSNKEIATELFISIGTVKRHTVNIFTKLDVKNRTEAVARARELGLL
jgi:LuxR family maltose regulon positive regulatory protein